MVKKGLLLSQSHREAISNGLKRYYSMNEMSQERRDNISGAQKKRLAKRNSSQVKAAKEAISRGVQKYYSDHDGPWRGIPHTEETKERISQAMIRHWNQKKQKKHVEWWDRSNG